MPLFEYLCQDCGQVTEALVINSDDHPECSHCRSRKLEKLISAHSSSSGSAGHRMPGPGDTPCCGSAPGEFSGCAGPGSCCGKMN